MASYEVRLTRSARKELGAVDSRHDRSQLVAAMERLASNPRPVIACSASPGPEQQAEVERRKLVSHVEAFKKMAAKVCPGCDRPIASMEGSESNFCVHCGMTLFNRCTSCDTRKMAFFRFCMACGTSAPETAKV